MSPSNYPKVDLPKSGVVTLSISAYFAKDSGVLSVLNEESLADSPEQLHVGTYRRSKTAHALVEFLALHPEDDDEHVFVSIEYGMDQPLVTEPVPQEMKLQTSVLERLSGLKTTFLRRYIAMDFSDETSMAGLFFPLPLRYSDPDSGGLGETWPMDELRGIRGVRYADGTENVLFSFILERPNNKDVSLRLTLEHEAAFDTSIVSGTIAIGQSIAKTMGLSIGNTN